MTARLIEGEDSFDVVIEDNGRGLPAHEREKLTEPYITTREKGTGLGLAIVKKIMEDHGGQLSLGDRTDEKGARIVLSFPRSLDQPLEQEAPEAERRVAG